ncbi:8773_t:CDS:2 [Funneliformis caledonium]|uniref:8773_t:CDS:1 n=1 Tax=Funneliformis caledonium TaxID=1117310 RepID=A0A9N9HNQ8_9GLOM|nr:8773_t:CDS:2 [Funneliformis caledonium]
MIEYYLCSLERIKSTETGQRREKVQILFDKYKEVGVRFTSFAKNVKNGDLWVCLIFQVFGLS